jgi:hypothetical protein
LESHENVSRQQFISFRALAHNQINSQNKKLQQQEARISMSKMLATAEE